MKDKDKKPKHDFGEDAQPGRNVWKPERGPRADEFLARLREKAKKPEKPKRSGSMLRRVSGGRWVDLGPEAPTVRPEESRSVDEGPTA